MGRVFYSADRLGDPFEKIREICFVIPNEKLRRQRSSHPKMVFFLDGDCRVESGSDFKARVEAGDLLIFPTPCQHYYASLESGQEARIYAFTIFFRTTASKPKKTGLRSGPQRELQEITANLLSERRHVRNFLTSSMRSLMSSFRQEQDEARPGYQLRMQALAYSLLVEIWRKLSTREETAPTWKRNKAYVINEVKELLVKSKGEPITLAEIARHVRWSEEHLSRVFKKETNLTVMDYLRTLRIDTARVLLLNTPETVSIIANNLGFASIGSFCRLFKHIVGQTPSEYRESHVGERR